LPLPLPTPCRHGSFLYNPNDEVGKSLELYGEWSEEEVSLFQPLLRSGETIVEVGANIGAHTVFFARAVGTLGKVVAIEPERLLLQTLCANLALNGFTNAYCYPFLLGETTDSAPVSRSNPPAETLFCPGNDPLERLQVIALDRLELPQCRLLKIDAPGRELSILKGAIKTIQSFQPILYIRNSLQAESFALVQFLNRLGYNLYWHRSFLYNPNNFFQNSQNAFGNAHAVNVLGFHSNCRIQVEGMEQIGVSGQSSSTP
ncbi:MAG: FkbM family methyltransferase, partial [Kovacikia sp.]